MSKLKSYTKILFILLISAFVSQMLLVLFVNNSPTVQPHLGAYLAQKFKKTQADIIAKLPKFQIKQSGSEGMIAKEEPIQASPTEIVSTVAQTSSGKEKIVTPTQIRTKPTLKEIAVASQDEVSKQIESIKTALIDAPTKMITKGVYAKSDNGVIMTTINTGEVESNQYTFMIDGKEASITIPKYLMEKNRWTESDIKKQMGL
ncbi:hypothetical protein HZC27_01595 [Candidatus Roizmanbacteria bacterium]|nr:hypothetical protein [Candidatus Roizmanbacteria bacterium]